MARQRAWGSLPGGQPEGADPVEGRDECNAVRRQLELLGRQKHLSSDEIVGEQESPDLLDDAFGLLATQCLFPVFRTK